MLCRLTESTVVVLVAVLSLGVLSNASIVETDDSERLALPLPDLLSAQWTIEAALDDDVAQASSSSSLLTHSQLLCSITLTAGAYDGTYTGTATVTGLGSHYAAMILGGDPIVPPPDEGIPGTVDSAYSVGIEVHCVTLTTCRMTLHHGSVATSHIDVTLQRRPSHGSRLRLGMLTWSPYLYGTLHMFGNDKTSLLSVFTQRNTTSHVLLSRFATIGNAAEEPTWRSSLMYAALLVVVVFGRWWVKRYFRRQGVDIDSLVRGARRVGVRKQKPVHPSVRDAIQRMLRNEPVATN